MTKAVGIDLGTTHTVVAMIDRGNYPVVSFEHHDSIPSIVSLDSNGELVFGRAEPGWTVLRSFKRLLADAHPEREPPREIRREHIRRAPAGTRSWLM